MSVVVVGVSCAFWSSDKEDVAAFSSHAPCGVDQAIAVAARLIEFALHWEFFLTRNNTSRRRSIVRTKFEFSKLKMKAKRKLG